MASILAARKLRTSAQVLFVIPARRRIPDLFAFPGFLISQTPFEMTSRLYAESP
jgi:hypothetical protein